MKKNFLRFLFAFVIMNVNFVACDDENDDGNFSKTTYEFSVDEKYSPLNVPAEGGEFVVLVTSTKTAQAGTSNVTYQIISAPEWVTAQLEQTSLVIRVSQNSSTENRPTGVVILQQDESESKLEIRINQAGFANAMSLEENYTVPRCKLLAIEPKITGFEQNPQYLWKMKAPAENEAKDVSTAKNFDFIQLETGEYEVTLTITDDSKISQTATTIVNVTNEENAYSPFISRVYDYRPGVLDSRVPFSPVDDANVAAKKVSDKLIGKDFNELNQNSAPLGSLGGYIIFGFDHTIINVPSYCDFRIGSGIGIQGRPTPGIVYVSVDKNRNGEPDDEWYELAGSEYNSTKTRRDVKVAYNRPASFPTMSDANNIDNYLTWTINDSEEGSIDLTMQMIMWNGMPQWPYWLREGEEGKHIVFEHITQLPATIEVNDMGMTTSTKFYKYGYACNSNPKNQVKSSFDIDWAVDKEGRKVKLHGIDFVKVQTGALQLVGNNGISGTIINSAIDLHLQNIEITTESAMNDENN